MTSGTRQKGNLLPFIVARVIHGHWCIAYVCVYLPRSSTEKWKVYPFKRHSVVGVMYFNGAPHVKPCTRCLRTCALSETQTNKYLESDGDEPRKTSPCPRGSMRINDKVGIPTILARMLFQETR